MERSLHALFNNRVSLQPFMADETSRRSFHQALGEARRGIRGGLLDFVYSPLPLRIGRCGGLELVRVLPIKTKGEEGKTTTKNAPHNKQTQKISHGTRGRQVMHLIKALEHPPTHTADVRRTLIRRARRRKILATYGTTCLPGVNKHFVRTPTHLYSCIELGEVGHSNNVCLLVHYCAPHCYLNTSCLHLHCCWFSMLC